MKHLIPRLHSWWLLWMATVITMAIVASSQLFTDRISLLLDRQATELLAADLLLTSNHPLSDSYQQLAKKYGLQTARTVELRTAIFINDQPQLVELKAVSTAYPLRGRLERKAQLFSDVTQVQQGPKTGELWVDSKLSEQLQKELELGYLKLPAQWILHYEPDRGGSLFNLAPRIMMHLDDLPASGLLVAGSRAKYKLLVAGEIPALEKFETFIKPLLADGEGLQTIQNARPEMRNALDRTRRFFALSIVLTLVIAMVAIAITARYAASQESVKVAVMRSFGISGQRLFGHYLRQIAKVWFWALPTGLLIGLLAQFPLQWLLGFWFDTRLPESSFIPYLMSALVGLVSLIGFSLPPLLRVIDTPPMQVFRQTSRRSSRRKSLLLSLSSLATLFIVLMLIIPSLKMAALLFMLVLLVAVLLPLILKSILFAFSHLRPNQYWLKNYVFSRLLSQNRHALFVMSGFTLTLLSVLLISLVKDQLLNDWERQLPQDKPNYFLVNIPSNDVAALTEYLDRNHIPSSQAYALVRARLAAINNQPVKNIEFNNDRANRLVNHVFNISYSEKLPDDNEIVEGLWLGNAEEPKQFSVEQGLADDMGLEMGDRLQFTLAGSSFEGRISSIRSVIWENFQPNFFIMGTKSELGSKPQTWLLSAYIAEHNKKLLKPLIKNFPAVTLLDISEIMQRIKGIIQRASLALEFFFAFAITAAIIVLLSALNTANHDREMEIALLQALGASKKNKMGAQIFEFVVMGLLVGIFAALFASLIGYILATQLFDLEFSLSPAIWIYSIVSAISLITLVGSLFIYRALSISPMRLLRS